MSDPIEHEPDPSSDLLPVTPSAEAWRTMSAAEREQFEVEVIAALNREAELMPEGRQHSRTKMGSATTLGDFFERIGRNIYLASELPVLYPGERPFAPDLMAVRDVVDPGDDDTRLSWSVAAEGRGIDLVLEILCHGDRNKDLVSNVARFARLQIPEYFVYDRLRQRLYGYHLPVPATRRYQSIPSRSGRLHSRVLDLDLAVLNGRLRFYFGEAEIPESRELIARLDALMVAREAVIEEEVALRQEAERRAEAALLARQEAEQQRSEAEQQRNEAEQQRNEAEQQRDEAQRLLAVAEARAEAEAHARADLEALIATLRAQRSN